MWHETPIMDDETFGRLLPQGEKLNTLENSMRLVVEEYLRATAEHGPFHSPHEGYGVLAEEFDELFDEIKANNKTNQRAEAIQVAAMALRFITDIR